MSDKEYKNTRDVNEVLSLKFHILQYIIKVSYLWEPSNGLSLRIKRFYIDYAAIMLLIFAYFSNYKRTKFSCNYLLSLSLEVADN